MPSLAKKPPLEAHFAKLAQLESEVARRKYLAGHKDLARGEVLEQLAELVLEKIRVNTQEALHLAEAALLIAAKLGAKEALALGLRTKANALYAAGDNRGAVEHHEKAIAIYEVLHDKRGAARTLNSEIQPLILLGEYDRAFAASERAREVFAALGETRRLAVLENNVGNILHRQDRFEEAVQHYERAYRTFEELQDWERAAMSLSNVAMCSISLNDFSHSLEAYQKARQLCARNNMPLLVAQADYNIAYLHYFRGEYSKAIEMLFEARRASEATGDAYHHALCYLDLSEIYLELNLSQEAMHMAREGSERFEKLGMGYEAAKTLANEGIAFGQQGKSVQAIERFTKARGIFKHEKNLVWPWLLDLYQGLLLFHEGRYFEARKLCAGAAGFFDQTLLSGKAVLAHLLLARVAFQLGELEAADKETQTAVSKIERAQAPVLAYQGHFLRGELAQARGKQSAALEAYTQARKALETLRSRLHSEELKLSFVKNRLQVYEALVELHLNAQDREAGATEAFSCIEAAKSRSMVEMIFQSGQSLPLGEAGQSELVRRIRDLREDLNWYYHRIELEQLRPEEHSVGRLRLLQEKAVSQENELLRTLRELPAHERENATLEAPADFSLERLQAALASDSALVEYYSAGDRIFAAVITRESIRLTPVSVVSRTNQLLHLLRFQLAKFRLGSDYARRFAPTLVGATQAHLEALHAELIAPIREQLSCKHLIVVPHGPLHFLPFHALRDNGSYLCDSHTVSYAPSATVFAMCQEKVASDLPESLVMGIPDERAPEILNEVRAVAELLPQPELYLGEKATAELLRKKGASSGLLHIATHGIYRQDNPMFSAIRLGDGYLNLYDLYQIRLPARLVTLSGCATGMNFVSAGDELLGLQRGLFCAGATSLLLSLWDVHDESTANFMKLFYKDYARSRNMAGALQKAMQQQREMNPHPYFWAPFVLIGKVTENTEVN